MVRKMHGNNTALNLNCRTKNITSILAEQEKDWQNRKVYDHISVPSFTVNAVPHKTLVDFDKFRRCNLEKNIQNQ